MQDLNSINRKTKEAYNKAAEKYRDLYCDELERKKYDRNILHDFSKYFTPGSLICDAGCGPCGHIAAYLVNKGVNIIGVDISDRSVEIAKSLHPEINFEVGDFSAMRFADNYFDGIISYYSIIDTPKKYIKEVLGEFNRVLKKGGYFLIAVKEGETEGFQNELLGIETEIYFSLFSEREIEVYLSESGFEIIMLEVREPYEDEIRVNRIFALCRKSSV